VIPPKVKARILTLHRLVGLVVAPVLLLVALSGGVLAWRPILGAAAAPGAPVDVAALRAALGALDPDGATTRVRVMPDGKRAVLETRTKTQTSAVTVDLATTARVEDAPTSS
jgi:sulfite reductase (NADPH) flavoprotein alpha-component